MYAFFEGFHPTKSGGIVFRMADHNRRLMKGRIKGFNCFFDQLIAIMLISLAVYLYTTLKNWYPAFKAFGWRLSRSFLRMVTRNGATFIARIILEKRNPVFNRGEYGDALNI